MSILTKAIYRFNAIPITSPDLLIENFKILSKMCMKSPHGSGGKDLGG
jgi:hypothetical protein